MASSVSKLIFKILCDNDGCLEVRQLNAELAQSSFGVKVADLRSVLIDDGKIAIRESKQRFPRGDIRPGSLIVAKTSLRLCQRKDGECSECDSLHLCRYFVCGGCTFGAKCKNPHSLASSHNAELLKRYGLQDLTEKQLSQLLLQNDPFLLPEVCPHYNKGDGPSGSCKYPTTCRKLHVCQHFLLDDCMFGPRCKRTHGIDEQGIKLFKGFSQGNIQNLYKIYRNKFIISEKQESQAVVPVLPSVSSIRQLPSQQPLQIHSGSPRKSASLSKPNIDVKRQEICLFNIRTACSYKEKCVRVHWNLTYKWEVLDRDGVTWKDLPDMEEIEKAYSDPSLNTSCTDPLLSGLFTTMLNLSSASKIKEHVDFRTMTYEGCPVRRLSTASSVLHPPHFILTTQWIWYWKEDDGSWMEYGKGGGDTAVTSETLEKMYLADKDAEILFQAGKHQYILHFKGTEETKMYQKNLKYQTKREIRRRPRFLSAQDVKDLKSGLVLPPSSSKVDVIPSHWYKEALPDIGYKLVLLSSPEPHYNVEENFRRTMQFSRIKSIRRIQNPSLWKVFQWQKEQMQKRNAGKNVDEKFLFHGTEENLVDPICDQNFDWRMCGVHGTAYGKGSYFARDASYSDKYSRVGESQHKIMFVARVLVGEYTKGRSSYVRPPIKPGSKAFYDSCVDSFSNPSIFVIFEKHQIYPEYLIKYRDMIGSVSQKSSSAVLQLLEVSLLLHS